MATKVKSLTVRPDTYLTDGTSLFRVFWVDEESIRLEDAMTYEVTTLTHEEMLHVDFREVERG